MIGIDTNVLVRFVVKDDPDETARASEFLRTRSESDPAYVSLLVLVEFIWVLRSRYRLSQERVAFAILSLMSTPALVFEEQHYVSALMRGANVRPGDLADHLIAHCARLAGCDRTVTFDGPAAAAIPSMELLE